MPLPHSIPDFQIGRDYEKIENARKLTEREYTVNRQLGYISLNVALNNDEVLAVAYEYTYNGEVFKVGEFSTDGITAPEALILKLIKGTTLSPRIPTWELMMKNIYNIGSGRIEARISKSISCTRMTRPATHSTTCPARRSVTRCCCRHLASTSSTHSLTGCLTGCLTLLTASR